ncbi:UNVERIFIED_CONTAM: hypothetical protein FKN15_030516 [Acipenser sinensis]
MGLGKESCYPWHGPATRGTVLLPLARSCYPWHGPATCGTVLLPVARSCYPWHGPATCGTVVYPSAQSCYPWHSPATPGTVLLPVARSCYPWHGPATRGTVLLPVAQSCYIYGGCISQWNVGLNFLVFCFRWMRTWRGQRLRMMMSSRCMSNQRRRRRRRREREAAASYSYKLVHKQDSQPSPEHRQQALSNSSNWISTAAGAASVHDSSWGAFSSMGELRLGRLGTLGAGSGLVHVKEESWEEGEREGKVQTNGSGQGMNFIDSISRSVTCKSNDEMSQAGFTVCSEGAGGRSSDCYLLSALHSKEPGPVSLLAAGSVVVDSASFPDGTRVIADPTGYPANAVTQQPMDIHGNEIVTHASLGQAVHAPVKILSVEPDGKRFGCLCGKRFAVKPKRDRHIMLTLSVRPFDCSVCEKKFKLKHHLNEHMKTHMGFLYKCERCGRRFRMRSCYLKHLQQEEEQLQQQSASASSVL